VVLPSHFCGLWLVLILKLNDVVALNWVAHIRKQNAATFKWLYKYFTSSSTVFTENSTFTVIIKLLHHWETPLQMVCLYNTSNCSISVLFRPPFLPEAAVLVFALTFSTSMSLKNSLKTVPQISKFGISSPKLMALQTPFLCNSQHFSVSMNSFCGNKDYELAGNSKLPETELSTCEIIDEQVERIETLIRHGLISLQFYLSL